MIRSSNRGTPPAPARLALADGTVYRGQAFGAQTVLDGDIAVPDNIDLGSEHDPDVADLIARLRTLTPQQTRVLGMLAEGLLNKQIAYELGVSEATIKAHVSAVLQKLNVDSRTQAVIRLSKIGADMLRDGDAGSADTAPPG